MIRIIARHDNAGMAVNAGGDVHTSFKTFDVILPEVEAYLQSCANDSYSHVQVVGVEVISDATKLDGAE